MAKVQIYTTPICPYCVRAKRLLQEKNVIFEEIDLFDSPDARGDLSRRAPGRQTVPQIFVGNLHIGGCEELYALERDGKLDPLLAAS